jgi:hypothetical protein
LDKIFQLYQADTSLASKYSNGQNPNPYANSALAGTSPTTGAANPYLSSPDAIAASTTPTAPGFSTPGLSLQASAQPAQSATTLLDLINSLTSTEQGIVNQKSGDVSQNYQDALSVLGTLATQFGDAYTASKSGSGGVGGSQNAATQYQTLKETLAKSLGRDPTETEVWQYIQNNRSTWEAEGLDMATIDKLEQQDAQRFGTGKTIPVTTGIKQKTMTVTPKTSTVKGKTTTTGWTVKMSDGSSKLITRPGSNWMSSDKTASYDPQLIVSEYQSAGATDEEIIQKLQVLGFIVQ